MANTAPKRTRAAIVGKTMRDDILAGRLRPGERLMFPEICKSYGASVGAIREALVGLVAQGLVKTEAHQGYIVTPLSHDDLLELTAARIAIEPVLLRESITQGDIEWESRVITTHHVMNRTPRSDPSESLRTSEEWEAKHEAFHNALFSGSTNRRLLAIVRSLGEEATLYRRWSMSLEADRDVAGEHQGLVDAAIARDADLAVERLITHISITTQLLLDRSDKVVARGTGS
jgi:DNA-binding GntR family transcriptional regulator